MLRGWMHVGAFLAMLIAGPLLVAAAHSPAEVAALLVYVCSIAALFGVSAAFHRLAWSPKGRRRIRRADHVAIFVAIAGTYTAIAVLVLRGWAESLILVLAWAGAAAGIAVRQLWLDAPKWAVTVPYLVVGWSALAVAPQLVRGLGAPGFALLVAGGAFYSAGAAVYARKRPDPVPSVFGYHEIFHACTVVGAALHFSVVAAFALPRA